MEKNTLIQVTNRDNGRVGYTVPELGVRRQFAPKETKEISFEELQALSYLAGGDVMLSQYLVVRNEEAVKELLHGVEPEYYYTEEDVKGIMINGSLDAFLDMLDFAPEGVLDLVKDLAVSLPLNDMEKRTAIFKKLNFDVTRAIEIQNTKYDGEKEDTEVDKIEKPSRRVSTSETQATTARRAAIPQYKTVTPKVN